MVSDELVVAVVAVVASSFYLMGKVVVRGRGDSSPPISLGEEKEPQYSMQVQHLSRTSSQHGLKERFTQYLPVMFRGSSIMWDTNIFPIL